MKAAKVKRAARVVPEAARDTATDIANDTRALDSVQVVADGTPPEIDGEPGSGVNSESLLQAVTRLAGLRPLEYDQVRDDEAERLNVRVSVLDGEVNAARRTRQEESGDMAMFPTIKPWPEAVPGAVLLDDLLATVQRFIVCEEETAVAASLWCAFTWVIDSVQVAPLAVITAPEKRCGKSQLLDLIGRLSHRPLISSNITPAAMFRVIEAHHPTLLIDEADTFLRENEALRGIINSGHTRQSAYVLRTVTEEHEPKRFSTWGAKALCGIGRLPETLMDRAVVLRLRRKLPGESVERLRYAEAGLFKRMASKLARFADDAGPSIKRARPALPDALDDRAQDNWEPLLAIADHAGGRWPRLARESAVKLWAVSQATVSRSAELLADIRNVFDHTGVDRLRTEVLLRSLNGDNLKPWATYSRGQPMTEHQLAKQLGEYEIGPRTVRFGEATKKGYKREWFEDVFRRYLAPSPQVDSEAVTPSQTDAMNKSVRVSPVTEEDLWEFT